MRPYIPPPSDTDRLLVRCAALLLAVFAAVQVLGTWVLPIPLHPVPYLDLEVYITAAQKARLAENPYLQADTVFAARYSPASWQALRLPPTAPVMPYLYPPALLLVFQHLPTALAKAAYIWIAANLAALLSLGVLAWLARARRPLALGIGLAFLIGAVGRPVYATLHYGQVNLLLGAALAWSLYLLERRRPALRALGYALAAAGFWVKLMPVAFSGLWALERPRHRLTALAASVAGLGLLVYLAGPAVFGQWLGFLGSGGGHPLSAHDARLSYSLAPLAADLHGGPALLRVLQIATAALAAAGVWFAYRNQPQDWAYPALLPTAAALFLLSPISWDHHLAFYAVPALIGLMATLAQRPHRRTAYVLTALVAVWMACFRVKLFYGTLAGILPYRATTLAALAVLALFGWMQYRQRRRTTLTPLGQGGPAVS